MDRLPIFLRLTDKPLLVIGGGIVAERKIRLLLRSGASITVNAPTVTPTLQAHVDAGTIRHVADAFREELVTNAFLIVAATDNETLNRRVADVAERAGRLCNVVDDNAASTFILPAIVDRSPVIVAIGTEGTAPVLARQIKGQIESLLPARIGELASQAGRWRDLVKKRFQSMRDRRRFWQGFFGGPIADHLLAGRQPAAEKAFRSALIGETPGQSGTCWIVGAGPGDPELVTLKARRRIAEADVVVYDRLVSAEILDFARKEADMIYVGKRAGHAVMTQQEINNLLVRLTAEGKRVCRLKGGDPMIFGRGAEEAQALVRAGLSFEIVPGITAAVGCASYAGVPLTLRGVSGSLTVATAKLDSDLGPDWPALLRAGHTLAVYMGIGSIADIRARLLDGDAPRDLPVAIVENGTTRDQRVVFSTVDQMPAAAASKAIGAPALIYIGRSVSAAPELQWFNSEEGRGAFAHERPAVAAVV